MGVGLSESERVLLERCRAGDERAWGDVYRRYAPRMARFLRGMMGQQDVDDLVQRVFVEFLSSLSRFRGESSLSTWLYRIAANTARKELRTLGRNRRKVEAYTDHMSDLPSVAADRRFQARQRLELISSAVADLDPKFRAVWVMRELEGLSVEEVAASLGVRRGTVRTRHHRARERVVASLETMEQERDEGAPATVTAPEDAARQRSVGDEQEVLP